MVRFRIIVVDDKALDWPKELPIPARGDFITIEDVQCKQHKAIMDKVHYWVTKSITEIRIETNPAD